jgi:predicted GIY-YIG superfamily endonuclease
MRALAQAAPLSLSALQTVRGMTDEKCEKYGQAILSIVQSATRTPRHTQRVPVPHPAPTVVLRSSIRHPYSRPLSRPTPPGEGIYVLELDQGRVYVGRTSDMKRRVGQHMSGKGSAFTRAFPPTGVQLPRLGMVRGSDEAAERDETLRYMFLRGIPLVRGWKYTRVEMPEEEARDAEENIRELFDLCRRCGHPGHFITQCRAGFDRNGRACK